MTDRSSEERSRFEKWALKEWHDCEYTNSIDTDYRDSDTVKMWDAWQARAALEDRQEAAPGFAKAGQSDIALASGAFRDGCILSGVPSEATPSKEKETVAALRELNFALAEEVARLGKKSGPRVIAAQSKLDRLDWTASDQVFTGPTPEMQAVRRKYHEAAPAPEVQGTPTSISAESASPLQLAAESTAPVGTPQKETPPISEEVAAWRALCPLAEFASVTKGAQGKEPQTFDEWWSVKQPFDGDSPAGAKFWARKSWAAGRRSAITELQEWAEQKHKYERQIRAAIVYRDVLAKCAELLEKP